MKSPTPAIAVSRLTGGSLASAGSTVEPATEVEVMAPARPAGRLPGLKAPWRASSFQRTSRQGTPATAFTAARVTAPATSLGSKAALSAPVLAKRAALTGQLSPTRTG